MSHIVKGLIAALTLVAIAVPATAAPGGNAAAAKACQQGGYASLQGEQGETFANTGQCVSYAAKGGTLSPIPPAGDPFACPADTADLGTFKWIGNPTNSNDSGAGWEQTSGSNDAYPTYANEGGGYFDRSSGTTVDTILLRGTDGEIAEDDPADGMFNRNSFSDEEPVPTIESVRFCGSAAAAT